MSHTALRTHGRQWVASAARTATGNSGALNLPKASSHLFIVNVSATPTGTSPTLDVAIQVSHDEGTTFHSILRFAQIAAPSGGQKRFVRISGTGPGGGEAGAEGAAADTGGAQAANIALSRKFRLLWTIGGTSPSYTFAIFGLHTPCGTGY